MTILTKTQTIQNQYEFLGNKRNMVVMYVNRLILDYFEYNAHKTKVSFEQSSIYQKATTTTTTTTRKKP
jgi:hypothetical protein